MLKIIVSFFYLVMLSYPASWAATVVSPSPKTAWRSSEIKVCFEKRLQPEVSPVQSWTLEFYKYEVSHFITQEIGKAGIRITGWLDCETSDSESIHINLTLSENYPAHVQYLGKEIAGVANGVNLHYPTDSSPEWYPRTNALHEFMHALGFSHEQERGDANTCKDQQSMQGETIDSQILIGSYDPHSIMNYCLYDQFPEPAGDHEEGLNRDILLAHLTEGDLSALKTLFFSPIAVLENSGRKIPQEGQALTVTGKDVDSYAYKFLFSLSEECASFYGYSEFTPVEKPLNVKLNNHWPVKLCLVGKNGLSTQPYENATVYVWPSKTTLLLDQSLELVAFSQRLSLESKEAKYFKIVAVKKLCLEQKNYRPIEDDKIVTRPSDWLEEEGYTGYLCLKNDRFIDSEHFFIIEDGLSFTVVDDRNGYLDIIPDISGGNVTAFRYAQIKADQDCPSNDQLYSPTIEASKTIRLSHANSDALCGLARYKDGSWSPTAKARKTYLSSDLGF